MTVRRWPDTLPFGSAPGYGLTPVDQSRRTDMEVGAKRVRRITFADLDLVTFEWRMTDIQFKAFRDLHRNRQVSLAAASDDIGAWTLANATRVATAAISPEGLAIDRLLETATNTVHRASMTLAGANLDGLNLLCRATLKAAGRTKARAYLVDRAGVSNVVDIDLAAGTLSGAAGLLSWSVEDRGTGWWRVTWTASTGTGASAPVMRIGMLDDGGLVTYLGDITKGINICELQARIVTGADLFIPCDVAGLALGAAGGSGWMVMPVVTGGGMTRAEARFVGPYDANAGPGLIWTVKAQVEVRNA